MGPHIVDAVFLPGSACVRLSQDEEHVLCLFLRVDMHENSTLA